MVIEFPQKGQAFTPPGDWQCDDTLFSSAIRQLTEYFAGARTEFSLSILLEGTDFQKRVWDVLLGIPYGTTISYGEVARRMGQETASRAVGAANNANPLPIVVPCHRVIGADKSMIGFGGGIDIKISLLEREYEFSGAAREQGDLFYQG